MEQLTYHTMTELSQDIDALSMPDQLGKLALHRSVRDGATLGAIGATEVSAAQEVNQCKNSVCDYPLHILHAQGLTVSRCVVNNYLMAQSTPQHSRPGTEKECFLSTFFA